MSDFSVYVNLATQSTGCETSSSGRPAASPLAEACEVLPTSFKRAQQVMRTFANGGGLVRSPPTLSPPGLLTADAMSNQRLARGADEATCPSGLFVGRHLE